MRTLHLPGSCGLGLSLPRPARRRTAVLVSAKYDYAAREQYISEVKRLINTADATSRTEQDGLTKVLIGVSTPLLKLIASTPPPKEPVVRAPPPPSSWDRGSAERDWRQESSSSPWDAPKAAFGGFRREPANVSVGQSRPGAANPQLSGFMHYTANRLRAIVGGAVIVKLLRAGFVGFAVSLFFGTIPFLDLLQFPDRGGALGFAVYSAAYLWFMLTLLRSGKLNVQQPFQALPDGTERSAEGALGNTPSLLWFSFANAAADGLLYRGALLTSVAAFGDIMVSLDPNNQGFTSPTTIIFVTAFVEVLVRTLNNNNSNSPGGYSYAGYGSQGYGASTTDTAVSAAIQFVLVAFLASETLSTGSLLGSIGTQALAFYVTAVAARQGWMQVPDGREL